MASKVIVKKQKADDTEGHLAIQHLHFNKKKIISLKERVSVEDFKIHFSAERNRFARTTLIDYKKLNKLIKDNINDLRCFGVVDKSISTSFIDYFKKEITLQTNPSTISVRNSVLKKMEEFKTKKGYKDIPFNIIDYDFIVELKNHIRLKNIGTTTQAYMNVVKAVLNKAKLESKYVEKFNYFKGLKYRMIEKLNSALTKEELQLLLNVDVDPNIYEVRMFLIAFFMHGIRASDLFLLRYGDFKKDKIEYISKKTEKPMEVRYDDKLVTLLCKVVGVESANDTNNLYVTLDLILDNYEAQNNKNQEFGATERLINHIRSQPKKNFLFKEFMDREPSLSKYNKDFEMTDLQHKAHARLVVHYSYILGKIAKRYAIDKITSHTSRYTFANLALDVPNPDLQAISKALGHSNLQTTINYFNKNFGKERVENLAKVLDSRFLL